MSVSAPSDAFTASLLGVAAAEPSSAWQRKLREAAGPVVANQPLPSVRDEAWRFNNVKLLAEQKFGVGAAPEVNAAAIAPYGLESALRLVFVNGRFAPELSDVGALQAGVSVSSLNQAGDEEHLGTLAELEGDLLSALNARGAEDGALVAIAPDVSVESPIHLLFVSAGTGLAGFPRTLVVVGRGSKATVIEDYVGLGSRTYTGAVSEVSLGESAVLRHARVQREAADAFHMARTAVRLGRDSDYQSVSITLGARMSRLELGVVQAGEGARVSLDGLAAIAGEQEADTHTTLDHAAGNGNSAQVHKCVIDNKAHAVFNGRIVVRKGAQLTDSAQSSRNLLLSDQARIDTKPQLEIFADEVKCAHGATVGQLDTEELFYLQSRGLSEAAARDLLIYAFAGEIVEKLPVPVLRQAISDLVMARTHHTDQAGAS